MKLHHFFSGALLAISCSLVFNSAYADVTTASAQAICQTQSTTTHSLQELRIMNNNNACYMWGVNSAGQINFPMDPRSSGAISLHNAFADILFYGQSGAIDVFGTLLNDGAVSVAENQISAACISSGGHVVKSVEPGFSDAGEVVAQCVFTR